jgi:hypothetical protein
MKCFGKAAMAIAALALALAPTARADVTDDNPSAGSRGPGDVYVAARGGDGAIYERHWDGAAFTPWASIGGIAQSGPAVVPYGSEMHVLVRGADDQLYQNFTANGQWSGWQALGGGLSSAPAAVQRRGTDVFDVVVRGTDNHIYHRWYSPAAGWSAWDGLEGDATSAPAINSHVNGVLNVFVRGTDGAVWQKSWDGSQYTGWVSLGGQIIGAPVAITAVPGTVDLFARGVDRATYQKHYAAGSGWTDWFRVDPTPMDSSPAAVADGQSAIDLFARQGGGISYKFWRDSWGPWTPWGAVAPPAPPAPPPPDGQLRLNAGIRCTPPGGRLKVDVKIRKRKGHKSPRVKRVRFFVKKGPHRTDRKKPFVVRLRLNRPAGSKGRVYATVYFKRSKHGKLRHKTVSRRFVMCG